MDSKKSPNQFLERKKYSPKELVNQKTPNFVDKSLKIPNGIGELHNVEAGKLGCKSR